MNPWGHQPRSRPIPPFSIPERTQFVLDLMDLNATGADRLLRMPNKDHLDWTLHVSTTKDGATITAELPFSEGRIYGNSFWWYGSDLESLRLAWTKGKVYRLRIVEDRRSQRTAQALGRPLYPEVFSPNDHQLRVQWTKPETRDDYAPPDTTYKVQWKLATGSWDNPANVSQDIKVPEPGINGEFMGKSIRGLTGGTEYHVRVIATNRVGDSEPSDVVSGVPKPFSEQESQPNSLARGKPVIDGAPRSGEVLTATTSNIEDDDGLTGVDFRYQWIRRTRRTSRAPPARRTS